MPHKKLIGSADAALLLRIDRSTLIRWIQAGKITPAVRVSQTATGAHLFELRDIERLLTTQGKRKAA